jgi:hypothetical protein
MSAKTESPTTITPPRRKVGGGNLWKVDAGGLAVLLAISAAAYFLGVLPVLERHAHADAQVLELTEARQKAQDSEKLLEATRKQLAAAKAEFTASPLQLQPLGQLNQRLAAVADIAARSGATLDDVQPGKAVLLPRLDTQPVRVTGIASFPSFTGLLHRIRDELPDSAVDNFDLTITNPTGVGANAKFDFDLVWYARPSPRAAVDPAAAKK